MNIVTKKEAEIQGLIRYFTGKPCKNGHVVERYTFGGRCLGCAKEHEQENKEKRSAQKKEWYQDNKERISAQQKEYRLNNPEKELERKKKCRESNLEYGKEWRKNNPENNKEWKNQNRESSRSYEHKRRAKTKEGEPAKVISTWIKSQPKICYYCNIKCKDKYHIDHYTPLSKGGTHKINNLRISCARCNMSKNAKDPYEFANSKGRLF